MKTEYLRRFRRAFASYDWTPKQRRGYAQQWVKSVRGLGSSWLLSPKERSQ